jgi:signal transduction histidine kinase
MHDLVVNLYALLENLLEWAQMQRGELSFIPREINLADIIAQNIGLTNQRAIQKRIIIINEVMVTEKVHADEHMLNTVLRNLLSNAVKFTRRDGKIIVRAKKIESEMVEVSVSDTGVGISETDVKKLFKIEEKVNSKGTEGELSTGLGLLLCKEFVEKHSGQIWVESKENVGSTFYFTLKM